MDGLDKVFNVIQVTSPIVFIIWGLFLYSMNKFMDDNRFLHKVVQII